MEMRRLSYDRFDEDYMHLTENDSGIAAYYHGFSDKTRDKIAECLRSGMSIPEVCTSYCLPAKWDQKRSILEHMIHIELLNPIYKKQCGFADDAEPPKSEYNVSITEVMDEITFEVLYTLVVDGRIDLEILYHITSNRDVHKKFTVLDAQTMIYWIRVIKEAHYLWLQMCGDDDIDYDSYVPYTKMDQRRLIAVMKRLEDKGLSVNAICQAFLEYYGSDGDALARFYRIYHIGEVNGINELKMQRLYE